MEAGQGRGAGAASSTSCSRTLAEGLRVVTVLLHPYMPATTERLLAALGATPTLALDGGAASARGAGGAGRRRARAAVPEARGAVIDSPHPPRPPASRADAELVAAAREAGVHADPHGRDRRATSLPRGARRRRALPAGVRRDRPPPERRRRASTTPTSPSCARSPRTRAAVAIGETGLDFYRDRAPRADQERAFAAQIELARETGKPLVIHTRAAEDETLASSPREAERRRRSIMHCFSMPERLDECLRARLVDLLRRQRHLPEGRRARATRPRACPTTACSSRPTRRT